MTLRQELGFEITESLLDEHSHKLNSTKKAVFDLIEEIYAIIPKDFTERVADLEDALCDYYTAIKREYYEAGSNIDTLVQRNCEKEVAEKSGKN